jgi:prepilin-type N-terminal cleavage/methylation domain-containing protein
MIIGLTLSSEGKKEMKNLCLNRKGMTLVEILIVAAIMGVLAIGFATMFSNAFKREAQLEHKQASREYRDEIDYALAGENCGLPATFFTDKIPVIPINDNGELPIFDSKVDDLCTTTLSSVGKIIGCNTAVGPLTIIRAAIGPLTYAQALSGPDVTPGEYKNVATGYYYGEIRVHFLMPKGAQNPAQATPEGTPAPQVITVSRHPVLLKTQLNGSTGMQELVGCRTIRDLAYSKKTCEESRINGVEATWIGAEGEDPDDRFTCSHDTDDMDTDTDNTICPYEKSCGTTTSTELI